MYDGMRANGRVAFDHDVRQELNSVLKHRIGTDHAVRPDLHVTPDFGVAIHKGGRVTTRNGGGCVQVTLVRLEGRKARSGIHDHGGVGRFRHHSVADFGLAGELPDVAALAFLSAEQQ